MPVDPRDYDVEELRNTAGELSLEEVAAATGPTSRRIDRREDSTGPRTPANVGGDGSIRRELEALERASDGRLERPYLEDLPASYDAEATVIEWMTAMVYTAGLEGTTAALRFYRSVGWIDVGVQDTLLEHAEALADDHDRSSGDLAWADHRVSLSYVARLAALRDDQDV